MTYLKAQTRNFLSQVRKQTSIATQETIDKSGSKRYAIGSEAEKCHAMPCHAPSRPSNHEGDRFLYTTF
ncbi:uncharacterized protein Bfra_005206 [Botrytis fragariae]|uniref:Uncharacterized protein n=1 Tax=Botrytis fragariae TaxID=1964551 RepID=A0A8H6AU77_9HELO|nr:uncharacterized protein Bfra_005206 [Botrytis fragariae]KAF5873742.1 hypothetical protein Bfra_005206 [Botrytis fragariae]